VDKRGIGWSDHGRVHILGNRKSRGYNRRRKTVQIGHHTILIKCNNIMNISMTALKMIIIYSGGSKNFKI
jgi:hypothetical protein